MHPYFCPFITDYFTLSPYFCTGYSWLPYLAPTFLSGLLLFTLRLYFCPGYYCLPCALIFSGLLLFSLHPYFSPCYYWFLYLAPVFLTGLLLITLPCARIFIRAITDDFHRLLGTIRGGTGEMLLGFKNGLKMGTDVIEFHLNIVLILCL